MKSDRFYVATVASDAADVAEEYKLGIEIDEFCTASNMDDEDFKELDLSVKDKIKKSHSHIFHAPFNELFPAAVDPMALDLANKRFEQSFHLAGSYGIKRMVVHSGYVPVLYFKSWFHEKSVEFWKKFMSSKPVDFHIMIENVLEDEPYTMAKIIEDINDKRVSACLDIGHAHCKSDVDLIEWIEVLGPFIGHVHLHNNDKTYDCHWPLGNGSMNMNIIMEALNRNSHENITFTVENQECKESIEWLVKNGWISK